MREIADNLWVHEDSMKMLGAKLAIRMSMAKLKDGSLWIHTPTPLTPDLQRSVESLGSVKHIVGASNGHNISLESWRRAFPDAAVYVAVGIPKKRPRLKDFTLLRDLTTPPWDNDLDQLHMEGVPFFDEYVFLHKESKSLLVTDYFQNHTNVEQKGFAKFLTKFVFEPIGFKGICLAPPLKMKLMVKDPQALRTSLDRLWQWDFERIIPGHGAILENNAKQIARQLCKRFYD